MVITPLHTVWLATTTFGVGLTDTVIAVAAPGQEPVVEIGTTLYTTEPPPVSISLIVEPLPLAAPVTPVAEATVHTKVLASLAVRFMFALLPLQTVLAGVVVTVGVAA